MDCHPDRSFSYPKGMRSGVEGPGVSCMNSNGSGTARRSEQLGMYPVLRRRDVS